MQQLAQNTAQTAAIQHKSLPALIIQLIRNDSRLIGRDSFLRGLFIFVIAISLFLRFALPWLAEHIAQTPEMDFDIAEFYPLIIGYIVIYTASLIAGMMVGFIILDERDNNTIKALLVTPLPLAYYIAYRIAVVMLLAFVIVITEMMIVNLAIPPLGPLLVIAAVGSLSAPLVMLLFATFAQNKVQGFAMNKIVGVLGLTIIAAWFIPMPAQLLFGLFPPYWFAKAYWVVMAGGTQWPLYLLGGVVASAVVLAIFISRFRKVVYR